MAKYIAFDTETEKGKAFLITTESASYEIFSFEDAMRVLFSLGDRFTTFNLDYDATALLAYLPRKLLKVLHVQKKIQYKGYSIEYLSKKVLIISKAPDARLIVFDIYPFFQTSLAKAGQLYAPRAYRKKRMAKSLKSAFTRKYYHQHRKQVDVYAQGDAKLTQYLTDKLVAAIANIGLETDLLYSPGFIAKRYFINKGISFGYLPWKFKQFVADAYFGAYIQCAKRGYFKTAHESDLKSAYPWAMSQLPDFRTAEYYLSKTVRERYYFIKAKVSMKNSEFYLLPFRKKGHPVLYPKYDGQVATMTCFEYEYLRKNKLCTQLEVISVLNIRASDSKPYADFVQELFDLRKIGGFESLVYKLILNSGYGITAEKVDKYHAIDDGKTAQKLTSMIKADNYEAFLQAQVKRCASAWQYWEKGLCKCSTCNDTRKIMAKKPKNLWAAIVETAGQYYEKVAHTGKMQNLAVAAFITAMIRVRMFDIMRKNSGKVIAVFTDGILTTEKPSQALDKALLGELEYKGKADCLMVGSGVYQFGAKNKMRGYDSHTSLKPKVFSARKNAFVPIPSLERNSLGRVMSSGVWQTYEVNELIDTEKKLNLNFDAKRIWDFQYKTGLEMKSKICNSKPFTLSHLLTGKPL